MQTRSHLFCIALMKLVRWAVLSFLIPVDCSEPHNVERWRPADGADGDGRTLRVMRNEVNETPVGGVGSEALDVNFACNVHPVYVEP